MTFQSEILLPAGAVFLETREIPQRIAVALHPIPIDTTRRVIQLYKHAKPEVSDETKKWHGWPIDENDKKIVQSYSPNLPPLKLPMSEVEWGRYALALHEHASGLDWEIKPELIDPKHNAAISRHNAAQEHEKRLRDAIESGDLKQLHPNTNLPTKVYLEHGKVPIEDFSKYVSGFSIGVGVQVDSRVGLVLDVKSAEDYAQRKGERNAEGRYTLEDAARLIADSTNERYEEILIKLERAAASGDFPMYEPGRNQKYEYLRADGAKKPVRTIYEEAYWNDLNEWLEQEEPRLFMVFQFPSPGSISFSMQAIGEAAQSQEGKLTSVPEEIKPERTAQRDQEQMIVEKLKELGYVPTELPAFNAKIKPDVKTKCWKSLTTSSLFSTRGVFNKAWERLLQSGDIVRVN